MRTVLVLATRNDHKIHEMKAILRGLPVKLLTYKDFPKLKEVREDGRTLLANAAKKAVSVARQTGLPAISDDTGLFVDALKGEPGVYSARYAGPACSFEDNIRKLLRALKDQAMGKRRARFECVIALATPRGMVGSAKACLMGRITVEPKGGRGFGYDPVFYVPGLKKTFAEISAAQKNRISHRGKALRRMRGVLAGLLRKGRLHSGVD